jgi:hypothetical protein
MQRLSIGAFSRLTHLSIKTLRYYHEVGLLEPAVIDPGSGYRYYQPGQAHSAHLVRRFRDLGLPVADVLATGPRGLVEELGRGDRTQRAARTPLTVRETRCRPLTLPPGETASFPWPSSKDASL